MRNIFVFVIYVEAVIYLLIYNLHDRTFNLKAEKLEEVFLVPCQISDEAVCESSWWLLVVNYFCKKFHRIYFFSIRVLFHIHWWFTRQKGKGGEYRLFHSTTSTRSQTFKHSTFICNFAFEMTITYF